MKELVLLGVSHKTAPVELRERLAVPEERLPSFLGGLAGAGRLEEAVVLSTCNRLEVYGVAASADETRSFLERELGVLHGDAAVPSAAYFLRRDEALRHLFRVAAGLESLVVGESEILGQVKRAYELARRGRATGKLTNVAFQRAIFVGKQVRAGTALSEGPSSVPAAAVALAQRIFGRLQDNNVLIVGAGPMAELAAQHLLSQKVGSLCVVNRTVEKARDLAERFKGRAEPLQRLLPELKAADVVLCSTGSPEPLLRYEDVKDVMSLRRGRPLFFIDIAVPRDVDPRVHTLENVYLYNIDDLEGVVRDNSRRHRGEIQKAEALVDEKTAEFLPWYRAWEQGEPSALRHAVRPEENSLSRWADKTS